jgi:hypothetical protein
MADGPRFLVELVEIPPGPRDVTPRPNAYRRLAGVLKALGRRHAFRCVTIEEIPPAGAPPGATVRPVDVDQVGDRREGSIHPRS